LAPRQGPEIISRACLFVPERPRHLTLCWFANQWLCLLCISCLETPRASGSIEPQSRTTRCELIGHLITSYSSMSWDPEKPHRVPGRDVIQCTLALLYQRRRSDGPKSLQGHLTIRADAHISLWSGFWICEMKCLIYVYI